MSLSLSISLSLYIYIYYNRTVYIITRKTLLAEASTRNHK